MTVQQADAHATGDCRDSCTHPDHAFDGQVDLDWLIRRMSMTSEQYDEAIEAARARGPVVL